MKEIPQHSSAISQEQFEYAKQLVANFVMAVLEDGQGMAHFYKTLGSMATPELAMQWQEIEVQTGFKLDVLQAMANRIRADEHAQGANNSNQLDLFN